VGDSMIMGSFGCYTVETAHDHEPASADVLGAVSQVGECVAGRKLDRRHV
jgi:hypothetical protein